MKKHLYTLILIMVLGGIYNNCLAQTTFEYSYDNAGNRVSRIVIEMKTAELNSQDTSSNEIADKGIGIGEMNAELHEKIEELT